MPSLMKSLQTNLMLSLIVTLMAYPLLMNIANVDIKVRIRVNLCFELMFKILWQIYRIFFLLMSINMELYILVNVQNAAKWPKNSFLRASHWLMFTLNSYPELMFKMLWQICRLFFCVHQKGTRLMVILRASVNYILVL